MFCANNHDVSRSFCVRVHAPWKDKPGREVVHHYCPDCRQVIGGAVEPSVAIGMGRQNLSALPRVDAGKHRVIEPFTEGQPGLLFGEE